MKMKKIRLVSIIVNCLLLYQGLFISNDLRAMRAQKIVSVSPELLAATEQGDLETMKSHIEGKELADETFNGLLTIASQKGYFDIVKYLATSEETKDKLSTGGRDNGIDRAFFDSVKNKHVDITKYLLTNPNTKDKISSYALNGNINNKKDIPGGLFEATKDGNEEIVKLLITSPSIKDKFNSFGVGHSLREAALQGDIEIVKILTTNPNTRDKIKPGINEYPPIDINKVTTKEYRPWERFKYNEYLFNMHYILKDTVPKGHKEIVVFLTTNPHTRDKITDFDIDIALKRAESEGYDDIAKYLKTIKTSLATQTNVAPTTKWDEKLEKLLQKKWTQKKWIERRMKKFKEKDTGKTFEELSAKKQFKKLKKWRRKYRKRRNR